MVSLIIPVYNSEKYLTQCLNSVCGQCYTNLEIICVDDGSTDESGKIVDQFASRDSRITAIHQQNGGESHARNIGLRRAKGDYIAFIDCDDWMEPDMYADMVTLLEQTDSDMVSSRWFKDSQNSCQEIVNESPVSEPVFHREKLMEYIYKRDQYRGFAYIWNKLYRRNLIYDKNVPVVLFDETLKLGGDVLFLAEIAIRVKKACYIDKAYYHYIQRIESGSHTKSLMHRLDWLQSYLKVIQRFETQGIANEIIVYVKRFLVYHSSNTAELAIEQHNYEVFEKCRKLMQCYENEYILTNQENPDRIKRYYDIINLRQCI